MKRRTQLVVVAAVLVGMVALSAVKRGGRSGGGERSGGACCPMFSGLNVWSTNSGKHVESTNGKPAVTGAGTVTNRAP